MPDATSRAPDVPVEWADASDAELSWEWDDMHMPSALTPLAVDYVHALAGGFASRYERLGLPFRVLARVWNGYAYFAFRLDAPEGDKPALMERYTESQRAHAAIAAAYWRDEALPELRTAYEWIASQPVESLDPRRLAEAWEGAWRRTARAWEIHFYSILGPYQVLDDLADMYESIVEGAPPGEALRLVQGSINELQRVERDLEAVTARAAELPAVATRMMARPVPSLEELSALPGGTAFVATIRSFLDAHGHLGQTHDDLSLPSWGEQPELLLEDVAKRLRQPAVPAEERRARLWSEAESLANGVRARLASRPDELDRFEATLGRAREIGHLTETHNYWIDRMVQARLRAFVMRVGRRLAAAGVLEHEADVLFLQRAEVPALLLAPEDRRALVAHRRAEFDRQRATNPPRYIGRPPKAPSDDRFDGARFEAEADGTLRGTGASAGVARGTARVVLGPGDFGRVQAGDIIVAPSSNPSWVPLFAIAGGLATNTGGVLSHAAVVAREFALPAVVGLGDATTRIADGRMVELDGTTGRVRLL